MDQASLIEDIISTKNTLTILQQFLIVNQISLQPFSRILDLITELLNILTHSSFKQVETVLLSTGSPSAFNELTDILNELSDAITSKNISIVNRLNEQLSSFVQKFRICSSDATNNEQTADDIFKDNLLQSNINTKTRLDSKSFEDGLNIPVSYSKNKVVSRSPIKSKVNKKPEKSSIIDPFAQFRFARRRSVSSSPDQDGEAVDFNPPPPPPPPRSALPPPPPPLPKPVMSDSLAELSDFRPSKVSSDKPRLMISYNHASKPVCTNIYKSLTTDGYDVWIDLEEMHGSTLVAMAQAIEESDIILYCITENYSQSRNCQKEAEYAFVQQKIMIPLLLQASYKPKGWLGLLMGASLYIDFTKNDFTQNYAKLKREIELNAMRISNNKNDVLKVTLNSTTNDQEQTHKEPEGPPLQTSKTTSTSNVGKSRGCVLF